jgi:hypothetical protein
MAIQKIDKYADYRYQIDSETELSEAQWLIGLGFFKDLEDYINKFTISEKRAMMRRDAEKAKRLKLRKQRKLAVKKTA